MFRALFHSFIVTLFATLSATADTLPAPQGEILLTVSGNVTVKNTPNAAAFDFELLSQFEPTRIETTTIWTEGVQVFEGVSLATLVDALGVQGETLRATAINDYAVEIPLSDAVQGGPILAYLLDGKEMSVRDKGPLWIIYPYDKEAKFRTEVIYSRSIWQLNRLEALE